VKTIQTLLNDSYAVTAMPPYGPVGTFTAFKLDAPMKDRIDYIFLSKRFNVNKYGTLTDQDDHRFPSDHFPVAVEAVLN
jgi:endonuclease/exonuclease/phosphatase family metal-dependent hydrolase